MLKTVLLNLPSINSQINRQPPASYTKVVNKGMTKAEMILKVVMTPVDPAKGFVEQYMKLLPECNLADFIKILEMKNVKRNDQSALVEVFRSQKPVLDKEYKENLDQESGSIRKLEKMIKKKLPNN